VLLREEKIDILVLNAGINTNFPTLQHPDIPRCTTVFGVNFVGNFLLLRLLGFEKLKNTRIICLSSVMHHFADPTKLFFDTENLLPMLPADYSESKLAMNLLARAISEARFFPHSSTNKPIYAVAVNPGAVSSEIWRHTWPPIKPLLQLIMTLFFLTPDQGAATTVAAAVQPTSIVPSNTYLTPYYQPSFKLPGRSGFEFVGPFAGARPAFCRIPSCEHEIASQLWDTCELFCDRFLTDPLT